MKKNVIIVSHRRSGTHLAIDSIINNFKRYSKNPEINKLSLDNINEGLDLKDFLKRIPRGGAVIKTHTHGNTKRYFEQDVSELFKNSKVIYVYRDVKDVLVSQYYYQGRYDERVSGMDINKYVLEENLFDNGTYDGKMTRPEFWKFHVDSWLSKPEVLKITFEEMSNDYEGTLKRVAEYIEEPFPRKINDVRRKKESFLVSIFNKLRRHPFLRKFFAKKYTAVSFRKGAVGDGEKTLSPYTIREIDKLTSKMDEK